MDVVDAHGVFGVVVDVVIVVAVSTSRVMIWMTLVWRRLKSEMDG